MTEFLGVTASSSYMVLGQSSISNENTEGSGRNIEEKVIVKQMCPTDW